MIITNQTKITTDLYDTVLRFSIDYMREYNVFRCRVDYGSGHGSVAFVRVATGQYIINKLQSIDINRKHWMNTDLLLWTMINKLPWLN